MNDDTRGATMEAVVSRMKTIQTAANANRVAGADDLGPTDRLRFLAVSATIPNVEDVSILWI